MRKLTSEVLVVGGGPAGTLVASHLARAGRVTVQVAGPPPPDRPFEVLPPAARQLLARHGLAEPPGLAVPCRGVLSHWGASQPDFHDYALTACQPGLAIDRRAFHEALAADAEAAGVRVLRSAQMVRHQAADPATAPLLLLVDGQPVQVNARLLVDATGRTGSPCAPGHVRREYFNRLVALAVPFETGRWADCLLVEAAPEGWWYVPPSINGRTQLVFLTDADGLPHGAGARQQWLRAQYGSAHLVAAAAAHPPGFQHAQGTDARFSWVSTPVCGRWVAVGDAALALDPLSGLGTLTALTGAAHVAEALARQQPVGAAYADWCRQTCAQSRLMAGQVYAQAAARFPDSSFWNRRRHPQQLPAEAQGWLR